MELLEIGQHCKVVRKRNKLTQTDIAKHIGLEKSSICRFEKGERDSLIIFKAYVEIIGKEITDGIFS